MLPIVLEEKPIRSDFNYIEGDYENKFQKKCNFSNILQIVVFSGLHVHWGKPCSHII